MNGRDGNSMDVLGYAVPSVIAFAEKPRYTGHMWFGERSIRAQRLGIEALGVGQRRLAAHSWTRQRRTLPTFAVVYIDRGSIQFESQYTEERTIEAGEAYFLFPGVWHSYGALSHASIHYWFLFEGAMADRWRDIGLIDPARPVLHIGRNRAMLRRWHECITVRDRRQQGYIERITKVMTGILADALLRGKPEAVITKEHEVVSRIIRSMNAALTDASFDLAAFCERSSLSYEYSRKLFTRIVGMPPGAYFKMLKMDAARRRLSGSPDSIAVIASAFGFDDPFYFSRWFKKFEKVSPLQYRASFGDFYGRSARDNK